MLDSIFKAECRARICKTINHTHRIPGPEAFGAFGAARNFTIMLTNAALKINRIADIDAI